MKIFRHAFIFLFLTCTLGVSIYASLQLWQKTTPSYSGLGLLMAASPLWIFVIIKGMRPQKLDAAQAFGVSCICGAGLAITMMASWKYGNVAGMAHLLAGGCLLGWVLYLKWYSTMRPLDLHD